MTHSVATTPTFERDLKRLGRRYRRIRLDLEPLIEQLSAGATPGDRLTGVQSVVYKVRIPNRDASRGKSGGYRVIYYLPSGAVITLLTIYSKTDQADISADEIARIFNDELGG
ncbi:MAG: type II toxin-antitoxin system RelE/ParE family toxin [Stenotrophobium sp.]